MDRPELDYGGILVNISKKCNQLLIDVDVNTVSDALDVVREQVEIAIEKYSFEVYEYWKSENKDADIARKIQFTDIENGYLGLVKKWVKQNSFKVELPGLSADETESFEVYAANLTKSAVRVGVAGTFALGMVYAVCCMLQTKCPQPYWHHIVAVLVESIGIAAICTTVKNKKTAKRNEIERQLHELEKRRQDYRRLISGIFVSSAEVWLKEADKYSDNIIKKF